MPGEQLAESGAAGPAEKTAAGARAVAKPSGGDSDGRVKMAAIRTSFFLVWGYYGIYQFLHTYLYIYICMIIYIYSNLLALRIFQNNTFALRISQHAMQFDLEDSKINVCT